MVWALREYEQIACFGREKRGKTGKTSKVKFKADRPFQAAWHGEAGT